MSLQIIIPKCSPYKVLGSGTQTMARPYILGAPEAIYVMYCIWPAQELKIVQINSLNLSHAFSMVVLNSTTNILWPLVVVLALFRVCHWKHSEHVGGDAPDTQYRCLCLLFQRAANMQKTSDGGLHEICSVQSVSLNMIYCFNIVSSWVGLLTIIHSFINLRATLMGFHFHSTVKQIFFPEVS